MVGWRLHLHYALARLCLRLRLCLSSLVDGLLAVRLVSSFLSCDSLGRDAITSTLRRLASGRGPSPDVGAAAAKGRDSPTWGLHLDAAAASAAAPFQFAANSAASPPWITQLTNAATAGRDDLRKKQQMMHEVAHNLQVRSGIYSGAGW